MQTKSEPSSNHFVICCIVVLILIFLAGCNTVEIESTWISHQITIDGLRGNDWEGVMLKINDQPIGIGFQNDSDYIYLILSTYDQSLQRQIFSGGLTIWFDSSGGNDKIFGIHYPLMASQREFPERHGIKEGNFPDEGARLEKIPHDVTDMEITRPSRGKKERVNVNLLKGISARVNITEGNLTYELKVPLDRDGEEPYFIGAGTGAIIGIGIETTERFRERTSQFERRRRDAEELPPGLRDDGTDKGDRDPSTGFGYADPLSFWAKVKLAGRGS